MSTTDDIEKAFTGAVPQDVTASALAKIMRRAMAEALTVIDTEGQAYVAGSRVGTAIDGYLDLHASDRGLRRATNETNDQLRERTRVPPKRVTLTAVRDGAQQIVGNVGVVHIVELPRSSLYLDRAGAYRAWSLTKVAGVSGTYDAQAFSNDTFGGTVEVSWTQPIGAGDATLVGLSADNQNADYTGVDFGLLNDTGTAHASANGVLTNLGATANNDRWSVKREMPSGVVTIYKNGVLVHTFVGTSVSPMMVDSSFRFTGDSVSRVRVRHNGQLRPIEWVTSGVDVVGFEKVRPEKQYAMVLDRGRRCGGGRGVVIALVPRLANAVASVSNSLLTTVAAGKLRFVQEYDTAQTLPRSAIYYPPTPKIMQSALTTAIDNGNWKAGYLFEDADQFEFLSEKKFGTGDPTLTKLTNFAPGLTRPAGYRPGARAIQLPDNTTQFLSSPTGFSPALGSFKVSFLAKIPSPASWNSRSILGYGSASDAGFFLLHLGTASGNPHSLQLIVFDGANSGVALVSGVPTDEWIAVTASYDKANTDVNVSWASEASQASATGDTALVTGSLTSALSDTFKVGALFSPTFPISIDALYYSIGGAITVANILNASRNLHDFITRP